MEFQNNGISTKYNSKVLCSVDNNSSGKKQRKVYLFQSDSTIEIRRNINKKKKREVHLLA